MLAAILAAFQALAALPAILDKIWAALAEIKFVMAQAQDKKYQAAVADYLQKTTKAKTIEEFKDAAQALHSAINSV